MEKTKTEIKRPVDKIKASDLVRYDGGEESRFYEFHPGDMTRYTLMITTLNRETTQAIVGGVHGGDYRMVTILGSFSTNSTMSYPINFAGTINKPSFIGYIGTKFGVNEHTAKMLADLLEYIRVNKL